jgi:hypothetical protein
MVKNKTANTPPLVFPCGTAASVLPCARKEADT